MKYVERFYRNLVTAGGLSRYRVVEKETDLQISSDTDLREEALRSLCRHRTTVEDYIAVHPHFLTSLEPLAADDLAPPIVRDMLSAASRAGVGPMASVAGAIAEYVGRDLLACCDNVIVENGGDIFLKVSNRGIRVAIFAGESPLSNKITLAIRPEETPLGICSSSATVGHSLSFGSADAVCVKSRSTPLADAVATAICNATGGEGTVKEALQAGTAIEGVSGIVIIEGKTMGALGDVHFI